MILKAYQPKLELERELFECLNPYSVQFRYPGEQTTIEEAKIVLVTMKKLRNMIREIL